MGRNKQKNKHLPKKMYQKSGSFYYVAYINGKKKWTNLGKEYPLALAKWADIEGSDYNQTYFSSAIDKYRIEVYPTKAKSTQQVQQYQLDKLLKVFGEMPINEIKTVHIQQYISARTAKVSANREVALMSSLFRNAISWGWTETNPCAGVFKNKEKKRNRFVTDDEIKLLKSYADETYQCLIDIAYLTAMRIGDILDIKLSAIKNDCLIVEQNKTGNRQEFEMTTDLRKVINKAKVARKTRNLIYLFTSKHGQQITKTAFDSAIRRLKSKCEIKDFHFHDLRARALTDAKRQSGLDYAQALGGHANQSQTESYIKSREYNQVTPLKLK